MKRQNIRKALMAVAVLSLPVTMFYLSPILTLQGAAGGIVTASLIFLVAVTVVSFFAGRVFCGWICPGGAVQEILFPANDKRLKGGKADKIKYAFAILWLGLLLWLFFRAGGVRSVEPLFGIKGGLSLTTPLSYLIFYIAMGGIVAFSLLLGRRPLCRYGCLLAPFMIAGRLGAKYSPVPHLHLEGDPDKCIDCKLCTKNCPMSLDVNAMVRSGKMFSSECIACGACVDVCPKKAIFFSWNPMEG